MENSVSLISILAMNEVAKYCARQKFPSTEGQRRVRIKFPPAALNFLVMVIDS